MKRSLLTDGGGIPLALAGAGANRHDMKRVAATLTAIPIPRPVPTEAEPRPLCLDKGYDYPEGHELGAEWGYTAHSARRGVDPKARPRMPGHRARRWGVERTQAWLNRFRRLLIRWEKTVANYLALLHLACAWMTFRAAGVFG